ncbi:hypothetical protein TRAPUB_13165 [Trametes pubescens]|uniref:Uncharacterized protein n=1 Tax=Trametes pubescens TaxID=154538 RepID=A0A1M2VRS6_TRAPU|nr:hypothetical protein TRAPUB_13165 [Trametes pubescens]
MSYVVDDSDHRILYSDGWEIANPPLAYHSTLHVAAKAGLTATFNFTGTWITVLGCGGDTDHTGWPSTAYDIDGMRYKVLTPDKTASPDTRFYNVTFFTSPELPAGDHTLVITNLNGTAPNTYWFDWLEFHSADFDAHPTTSSSKQSVSTSSTASQSSDAGTALVATSSNPTIPPSPTGLSASASQSSPTTSAGETSNSNGKSQNLGAIIGGSVGGALFLAALVVLSVYVYLKQRYSRRDEDALYGMQHDKPQEADLAHHDPYFSEPPLVPATVSAEAAGLLPYSAASTPPRSLSPAIDTLPSEPAAAGMFRFRSMRKGRAATPVTNASASGYSEPASPARTDAPPETVLSSPPAYTPE